MNLADVVSSEGIKTNENSGLLFGEYSQLEVVGYSGKSAKTRAYSYILKCSECSKDPELFGEGYFTSKISDLNMGKIPCGCSKVYKWSKEQYSIRLKRALQGTNISFLSVNLWKGNKSKISLHCTDHGEFESTIFNVLFRGIKGCLSCRNEKFLAARLLPDEYFISKFLSTGKFKDRTTFKRAQETNYWEICCGHCNHISISHVTGLLRGCLPCACYLENQVYAYIHRVYSTSGQFLKFGITSSPHERLTQQRHASGCEIELETVFKFSSNILCRAAESECKNSISCGVVSKKDFPDGYTETWRRRGPCKLLVTSPH